MNSSFLAFSQNWIERRLVGMPDEGWGEARHAFVVLKAATTATEAELRNYARDQGVFMTL